MAVPDLRPRVLPERRGFFDELTDQFARARGLVASERARSQQERAFKTEQATREELLAEARARRQAAEAARQQSGQGLSFDQFLEEAFAAGDEPISEADLARVGDVSQPMPDTPLQPRSRAVAGERPVLVDGRVFDPTAARLLQESLGDRAAEVETGREIDRAHTLAPFLEESGLVRPGRGVGTALFPNIATSVEVTERQEARLQADLQEAEMRAQVQREIAAMRLTGQQQSRLITQTNAEWRRLQQQNKSDPQIILGRRPPFTYQDAYENAKEQLGITGGGDGMGGGGGRDGETSPPAPGRTPPATDPVQRARQRAEELQRQGLSREQIRRKLIEEGLIRN